MIERLHSWEQEDVRLKINELIGAVNDLRANTLLGPQDDDTTDRLSSLTTDGLLQDFVQYVADNPGLRFFQALRNWSGYTFIFGSTATTYDDFSQLEDTYYKTTKGPVPKE